MRRALPLVCLLLTPVALAADPVPVIDAAIAAQVADLMPHVSALRGLPFLHPVPIELEEPEQVRAAMLGEELDEEAIAELELAARALRVFRAVPDDYDLLANTIDVLTESVGGYYDPETRRLVLVRRGVAFEDGTFDEDGDERMVAAHELVHALQDQNLGLWSLSERDYATGDAELAVLGLVEGDASYAMLLDAMGDDASMLLQMDGSDLRNSFMGMDEGYTGALARMPRLLRDGLIFPYTDGTIFVHEVFREAGPAALDALYASPPLSTEQILHPDRFLAGDDPPLAVVLPELADALGAGWTTLDTDAFGELGARSWLRHLGTTPEAAAQAAAGWGGDVYSLLAHDDGRTAAVWVAVWDTPVDAREAAASLKALPPVRARAWQVWGDDTATVVLLDLPKRARGRVLKRVQHPVTQPILTLDQVSTPTPDTRPPYVHTP